MAPQLTSAPTASTMVDKIASILESTGYVLPALLLTLIAIILVYPDRVPFTHPFLPNIPVMPGKRREHHSLFLSFDKPRLNPSLPIAALPLIGHTHHIVKNGSKNQFENFKALTDQTECGAFQSTILGLGKQIMLVRPEYIEAVQKTNFDNFVKGPAFRVRFSDVLGNHGIFVSDGDVWKTQRKRASHIFSAGQFRNWVQSVVHGELRLVTSILEQVAAKQKAGARNNHLVLSELFFRYTLSSFSKMAFSHDMGALDGSPECLHREVPFA
jgi:Cytochrome P450